MKALLVAVILGLILVANTAKADGMPGPSSDNALAFTVGAGTTTILQLTLPKRWSPNTRTLISLAGTMAVEFLWDQSKAQAQLRPMDNGNMLAAGLGSLTMLQFKF